LKDNFLVLRQTLWAIQIISTVGAEGLNLLLLQRKHTKKLFHHTNSNAHVLPNDEEVSIGMPVSTKAI
jgi:hypothetical protein